MSAEHTPDVLSTDELYFTDEKIASMSMALPQLSARIAKRGNSDDPASRYLNGRLSRIHERGWRPHTPFAVATIQDTISRLSRTTEVVSLGLGEELIAAKAQQFESELEIRREKVALIADFVANNPTFAIVTDFGSGMGGTNEHRTYAGRIVDVAILTENTSMILEPVVEGPDGKVGRMPRLLLGRDSYSID